jgi:hypothetical protein
MPLFQFTATYTNGLTEDRRYTLLPPPGYSEDLFPPELAAWCPSLSTHPNLFSLRATQVIEGSPPAQLPPIHYDVLHPNATARDEYVHFNGTSTFGEWEDPYTADVGFFEAFGELFNPGWDLYSAFITRLS